MDDEPSNVVPFTRPQYSVSDQNIMLIRRERGVPAEQGTEESDRDPSNPNTDSDEKCR